MSVLYKKFNAVEGDLNLILFERREIIHGLTLAMLSNVNMLLLGPPGTGKSLLVSEWSKRLEGSKYFSWMLSKFSTPEELFGPYSLLGLEEDHYKRVTAGKLPEANFGFIDEIFKAGAAILNSMLTLLNERIFYNDGIPVDTPLLAVIGASNEIPETEDGLDALYDRFQMKFNVHRISETRNFKQMLKSTLLTPMAIVSLNDIITAKKEIDQVNLTSQSIEILTKIRNSIESESDSIYVTDRTYKTCVTVLKAEAWLQGRNFVDDDDFIVLQDMLWTEPKQIRQVASIVLDIVNPEQNKITNIFETACDLAYQALDDKSEQSMEVGLEAANKVKDTKVRIEKYIVDMKEKSKDTKQAKTQLKELDILLTKIFKEVCGIDKGMF